MTKRQLCLLGRLPSQRWQKEPLHTQILADPNGIRPAPVRRRDCSRGSDTELAALSGVVHKARRAPASARGRTPTKKLPRGHLVKVDRYRSLRAINRQAIGEHLVALPRLNLEAVAIAIRVVGESGRGGGVATAPRPKNRACPFPNTRLEPGGRPVRDAASLQIVPWHVLVCGSRGGEARGAWPHERSAHPQLPCSRQT